MADDEQRRAAFVRLQPICSKLLQDRINASTVLQSLDALRDALSSISSEGLRGCQDYVLFPLMLIVDSIAVTRLPAGMGSTLYLIMGTVRGCSILIGAERSPYCAVCCHPINASMCGYSTLLYSQNHQGPRQFQLPRQTELQKVPWPAVTSFSPAAHSSNLTSCRKCFSA